MNARLIAFGLIGSLVFFGNGPSANAADGLNEFDTKSGGIPIRIGSSERQGCVWGDYDAIRMELNKSSKKKLLVSLEPLIGVTGDKGEAKGIQTREISGVDFAKGFLTKFDAPAGDKPSVMALYICKDSAGDGKCSGKPSTPLDTVLRQHLHTTGKNTKPDKLNEPTLKGEPVDRIYYFAPVFYNKGKIQTLKSGADPKVFPVLQGELDAAGVKDSKSLVDVASAKNTALRSIQPEVSSDAISINLPRLNSGSCGK